MSTSHSEPGVRLEIRAPEQTTEIFLIDGRFRRLASGLGELHVDVPPGLYKVRFRSGAQQRDALIEAVASRSPLLVSTDPLGFASAAPIAETSTSRGYHREAAARESTRIHLHQGRGSQLFVFARDLLDQSDEPPWTGISLHEIDGTPITGLEQGVCNMGQSYAALNVELDPGTYRLRVDTEPLGSYELFLVTRPGWQTQAFVNAADFQAGDVSLRRAALKTAAVFMARSGLGFHPAAEEVRLAELARQGLAGGRNVLRGSDLNALLRGKFENPILGIYGAHLLLQAGRPDQGLVETVAANLRELVGAHPDVEVLGVRRGAPRTAALDFPLPPMLRASWEIIVKVSLRRASIVPPGSISEHLSDGMMSTTPWLLHRITEIASEQPAQVPYAQARRTLARLVALGQGEARSLLEEARGDRSALSPLERGILQAALGAARIPEFRTDDSDTEQVSNILRSLRAPTAAIARSTMSLATKLHLSDET
jgi:regulator of protease activity HflC (stomatin/prohibitin superfamily)